MKKYLVLIVSVFVLANARTAIAVPAAVDTWSEKLLTAPTVGADCDTASP